MLGIASLAICPPASAFPSLETRGKAGIAEGILKAIKLIIGEKGPERAWYELSTV